ncbi:MAG: hypothetical protein N2484_01565 [Clostridia bacterium]|nr:hypothetical protein [Clostridia bacterium]
MNKPIVVMIILILIFAGCSTKSNDKANESINEHKLNIEAVEKENSELADKVQITHTNIVDKSKVKVGDRIAGLTVKSLEIRNSSLSDIIFSGRITVTGEYTKEVVDGSEAYIFVTDSKSAKKLPQLKDLANENSSFIIRNMDMANPAFKGSSKGNAAIVIDEFSIGEREISASAKIIEAIEVNPQKQNSGDKNSADLKNAFEGEWIVVEKVGSQNITAWDENDAKKYLGTILKVQKPTYITKDSAAYFEGYKMVPGDLKITEKEIQIIEESGGDDVFIIKDKDTLLAEKNGVFFKLKRKSSDNSKAGIRSSRFGFFIPVPANWTDRYTVEEADTGINVYFNPQKPAENQGVLFYINKKGTVEEGFLDNVKYFDFNGMTFVIGQPTDVSFDTEHPEFNIYCSMSREVTDIVQSLKPYYKEDIGNNEHSSEKDHE